MSAIKGAGAILSVASGTSGGALSITGASQATACLVTVANALSANAVGVITGVGGMTQLNGRAFTLNPVTGANVTLKGENSTGYAAYTSGGTLQAYSMETIANITDIKGWDGQPSEIDITNLQSLAKEWMLGLQDFGTVTVGCFLLNSDAGQAQLRSLKQQQIAYPFTLSLADGTVGTFMAFVKQFGFDGVKPEGAVSGSITLRVTNAPAWFA